MGIRHDVIVELFYSGTWNDHSSTEEVYTGDATNGQDVTITAGGGAESGGITPATASLTFKSWRFNPDNVGGDLYGLITRNTPIRITVDDDQRFEGKVSEWEPGQSLGGDVQEPDRWVSITAGGELRRIEAGTDPLPSSLRTFYRTAAAAPVAYWPLDGGQLSTVGLPDFGEYPFDRGSAAIGLASADIAPWLEEGVSIGTGENVAGTVVMSEEPTRWVVDAMIRCEENSRDLTLRVEGNSQDPSGNQVQWRLGFGVVVDFWELSLFFANPAGNSGAVLDNGTFVIGDDQPHHVRLAVIQDGTDADWVFSIDGVTISSGTDAAHNLQGVGQVRMSSPAAADTVPSAFGHVAVWEGTPPARADTVEAAFGYDGEFAGDRFARLCGESDVTDTVAGTAADTVPMGPQFRGTLAAQFEEIAQTDDGIIFDTVAGAGVTYKTGRDKCNQEPTLTLDYAAFEVAPPLRPILDDKAIRNDITADRRGGGTFRAVDETSVAALGRYTSKPEVNVFSDLVLPDSAGWFLHVGTSSGTRFTQVTVDLDACPHLVPDVVATGIGDRIAITNLPAELTPNTASLLVNGWSELAARDRRRITFNCMSEAPFHVPEVEHDDYGIIDADDGKTTVRTAFNTETGTQLDVTNEYGQFASYWSVSISGGFDILVAGVRLAVTAVVSDGDPDFHFTVTQGPVNGVLKTIPVGAEVHVYHQSYIGL